MVRKRESHHPAADDRLVFTSNKTTSPYKNFPNLGSIGNEML